MSRQQGGFSSSSFQLSEGLAASAVSTVRPPQPPLGRQFMEMIPLPIFNVESQGGGMSTTLFAGIGRLKLTAKIAGLILVTLAVTSAAGFLVTQHRVNKQAEESFVDRLRKTDGMAAKVRTFFSAHVEDYVPNHNFKRISQVPVVVAWTVAREYAETQGMKFSTPSLSPRNSKNMADRFETEALRAFAQDPGLKEYYRRDTADGKAVMRYAQPVRLTEDCLFCHGDPVGAKDPFGYRKEGMKAGDIKGAFVVTAPLDELTKTARANSLALLFISICTLLAAVGVVFMVVRRWVVRPITASTELARQIATNNLSAEDIEVVSGDEVGDAVAALNTMKNNLHSMVENIAATAERIASAGHELASTSSLQSAAASTQTDRTAQVATAMHEMSSTVLQVSESAREAADAAGKATETANIGGKAVEQSSDDMRSIATSVDATAAKVRELGKSSNQIGEIVAVIGKIADQTNLLALNAAIEAARAGDHGRGFAVVADEVRKLAERTTVATKEIAGRINTIQTETTTVLLAMEAGTAQVERGVKATERTGESLQEIIRMNDRVRDMISQIAATTAEQSATSEQVSNNIGEIARLAQESSNGADEAAKACDELSAMAMELEKIFRLFTLRGNGLGERSRLDSATHPQPTRPQSLSRGAAAGERH
jgi:methyl-accepting chemotaxis protein